MTSETHIRITLTRADLEMAVRNYCSVPSNVKLDGFWVKSECLGAPQSVCGFSYEVVEPVAQS